MIPNSGCILVVASIHAFPALKPSLSGDSSEGRQRNARVAVASGNLSTPKISYPLVTTQHLQLRVWAERYIVIYPAAGTTCTETCDWASALQYSIYLIRTVIPQHPRESRVLHSQVNSLQGRHCHPLHASLRPQPRSAGVMLPVLVQGLSLLYCSATLEKRCSAGLLQPLTRCRYEKETDRGRPSCSEAQPAHLIVHCWCSSLLEWRDNCAWGQPQHRAAEGHIYTRIKSQRHIISTRSGGECEAQMASKRALKRKSWSRPACRVRRLGALPAWSACSATAALPRPDRGAATGAPRASDGGASWIARTNAPTSSSCSAARASTSQHGAASSQSMHCQRIQWAVSLCRPSGQESMHNSMRAQHGPLSIGTQLP